MTDTPDPELAVRAHTAFLRTKQLLHEPVYGPPDPDTLRQLEAAVASMPRLTRDIFVAIRLDDMNYDEIARRTGLSASSVQRQFANGLYHLSHFMEEGVPPSRLRRLRRWLRRWSLN